MHNHILKLFFTALGVIVLGTMLVLQSRSISYMRELEEKMKKVHTSKNEGRLSYRPKRKELEVRNVVPYYDQRQQEHSDHVHERAKRAFDGGDSTTLSDSGLKSTHALFLETPTGKGGGGLYVRWGRTVCGNAGSTELVYSGIAGGSWFEHTGAASNFLCLPLDPVWGRYSDGAQGLAFVYGAEYQDGEDLFLHTNAEKVIEHNVPCAVCRSKTKSSVLMIPARNVCNKDWHLEYHGYLMTGHHAHKGGTEYICVDEAPEADPSGFRDENGRLLYRVEAACGSLPCPNYVASRDFSCAVCSK